MNEFSCHMERLLRISDEEDHSPEATEKSGNNMYTMIIEMRLCAIPLNAYRLNLYDVTSVMFIVKMNAHG